MIEKAKKVYETPSMTVYEMGRTQILAGSGGDGGTQDPNNYDDPFTY